MTGQRISPALQAEDVDAVLAAHGFGTERPRSGAVLLALVDPLRVVWANQAAATLFDTTDVDDLYAQIFAGRGREGLGASVLRLAPDALPRIERLRLIKGFRSRTLTVLIGRSRLADGRSVIVISAPGHDMSTGEAADFALSVLGPTGDAETVTPEPAPVEAVAAAPAAAQATSAPVSDALRERLAILGWARLLWQTDVEGRIVKLDQGVPEMLGVGDPAWIGRPLPELLARGGADMAVRVAEALAARSPCSGLSVLWPLATGDAAVAVTLGAVPIVARTGFAGFRGFGVADLTTLLPASPLPGVAPGTPELLQENAPPVEAPAAAAPPPPDHPAAPVADEPAPVAPPPVVEAPAREAAPPRTFGPSSKVVALRPHQTFQTFGPQAASPPVAAPPVAALLPSELPPAAPVESDETADILDLSSSERSNFDEIGRALLGGEDKTGSEQPAATAAAATPAAAAPEASAPAVPPAPRNAVRVVETLAAAMLVVDGDRLIHANPAFAALTGYRSLDALRDAGGVSRLFGGLDYRSILAGGEDRAVPVIGAQGDVLPMQGRMQAVEWDDGTAGLITLHPAADRIAQVQRLEEQVRRRDADLAESRMLLDHVGDAVLTADRQGRVLMLNGAAERLFGYTENGIVGEPLASLIGTEGQAAVAKAGDGPDGGLPVSGRSATGKMLPLQMTWWPIGPQKVGLSLRDRSEPSSLQSELSTTRDRLDQALADKPDLLAKISHEIRTPLNAILGFAEVILDERFGPIGNERYKAYLRDIHDSGAHVLSLLNDMLDLSKMEAGRLDMHPSAIDVNRVIAESVGEMQTNAHRERVIMRLSLPPHLSAALVDERAFRQIVGNIISNAINFNEPGGQVIVSTAMNEAGAVAVRVRDTGIGMTDQEIAQAMEPFRQIKTAKPGSGNGLGLPLARALVEANGATMSIKSQKNEGTLVEIVLPACPAQPLRVPAE